jgi:putative transposase
MITDAYSRKIVGWSLHDSLQMQGPLSALEMALTANKRQLGTDLIHHSDRGVQYCSRKYTDLLRINSISISMTEQGDPYENALAERMNRTIKEEMLLNKSFFSFSSAEKEVRQAIENYNNLRPHGTGSPVRL